MNSLPYDAVIFDLDGTLFNSEQGIVRSALYAMEAVGYTPPESADVRGIIGPPLRSGFCGVMGMPEALAEKAVPYYRDYFNEKGMYLYSVYPNIRTLLKMLKGAGVYVALATSKPPEPTHNLLRHFGMDKYFDRVITESDDAAKFGKAELVRRALPERYRKAAMVGDRMFDIEGALANGIDAIGAGYGFGSDEELTCAGATHIAPDTGSLLALLCPGLPIPRGFFLTVEGLDGSGKTTQVDMLEKALRAYGFNVLRTREPGGCEISEEIRGIVLSKYNLEMCKACEALLYAAARAQHVYQVIRPAVERGMLVLCDRFVDSSIAYQGGGRELGIDVVAQLNQPAVGDMLPDATLYLAIDHITALERRHSASEPDRLEMESAPFHERVQKAYERLIHDNKRRFVVVDASYDVEKVSREALRAVLSRVEPDIAAEG